ncbi:MAG: arsenate reductase family protein, partial [Bacteroidales bacterium]
KLKHILMIEFIQYSKCGTCRKAAKWLQEHQITVESRDIITENPTAEELAGWIKQSGIPAAKFFNTSGLRYKELNLKDKVKTATEEELIALLASEGKLVKRPVLSDGTHVLIGFKEEQWSDTLLNK